MSSPLLGTPRVMPRARSGRRLQQVFVYGGICFCIFLLVHRLRESDREQLVQPMSIISPYAFAPRNWNAQSYLHYSPDSAVDFHHGWSESAPSSPLSSSQKKESLPDVHLLLPVNKVAARRGDRFCKTAIGAIMTGYKPFVYNWGGEAANIGKTHRQKVSVLRDILRTTATGWREDDLIFVIDALDVWLQLPPADVARRFAQFDQDLVYVGAEKHCAPNPWDSPECRNAPESPLPKNLWDLKTMKPASNEHSSLARHANSGTILGRKDRMAETLTELASILEAEDYGYAGDQASFNQLLGKGGRRLGVDYYHRLFWPSAADDQNMHFINTPVHPDHHLLRGPDDLHSVTGAPINPRDDIIPWDSYPAMGHHQLTGQVPIALHFNGYRGKDLVNEWWGIPWYSAERFRAMAKEKMADATISVMKRDGTISEDIPIRDICWDLTKDFFDGMPDNWVDPTGKLVRSGKIDESLHEEDVDETV
ncbi:hypothetical protein BD324DRAFT_648738 [Kockovaella imperatae]|uniref:Uncharacterized protein n=1 Tax=Kockovaella imperatae TaxID=4999 RepID=A0A1Y1URL1_9TREE|nr:hypothetical protein BD324DRAFT_648738 [Kockovaella imperatae]ORX40134.1 hypothetical protein BD324DRAFT_648738 [Kockovaella imperatae]